MEKLIQKIAHSFEATTGLPYDDLLQEASLAYLEALKTYDESRGRITTHLWHCVSNRLKTYIKQENVELVSIEDYEQSFTPLPFWERLSKDAMTVAKVVLDYPLVFLELGKTNSPNKIKEIFTERGWDKEKIKFALFELKNEFSS